MNQTTGSDGGGRRMKRLYHRLIIGGYVEVPDDEQEPNPSALPSSSNTSSLQHQGGRGNEVEVIEIDGDDDDDEIMAIDPPTQQQQSALVATMSSSSLTPTKANGGVTSSSHHHQQQQHLSIDTSNTTTTTTTTTSTTIKKKRKRSQNLRVTLPPGAFCLRAPILAKNWVTRGASGSSKPKALHGDFVAILLDDHRLHHNIHVTLVKKSGYNASDHDVVVFFEKKGQGKLEGTFGVVTKGSWKVWDEEAYEVIAKSNRQVAESFQHFIESEPFHWLQCGICGKWRMYPHDDVILPNDAFFLCDLAGNWNPAIKGCETAQEFSEEGTGDEEGSTAAAAPPTVTIT